MEVVQSKEESFAQILQINHRLMSYTVQHVLVAHSRFTSLIHTLLHQVWSRRHPTIWREKRRRHKSWDLTSEHPSSEKLFWILTWWWLKTEASVSIIRPSWLSRMLRGTETSRKQKKFARGISIIHFNTTVRGQECLCTSATSNLAAFKHVLLRLKFDLRVNYGSELHSLD